MIQDTVSAPESFPGDLCCSAGFLLQSSLVFGTLHRFFPDAAAELSYAVSVLRALAWAKVFHVFLHFFLPSF